MNFLITAGNTQTPIDRTRVLTGVATGKTGAAIARTAWGRGHTVTLLTSRPEALLEYGMSYREPGERFAVSTFRTYDDLTVALQTHLRAGGYDAVCHAAGASDFIPAGTYSPAAGTFFNARTGTWEGQRGVATLTDQKAGKITRGETELWLRLVRAPRLIDRFRSPWGFAGVLIKFKIEVDVNETELLELAEISRTKSSADLVVAATLDSAAHYAYVGPEAGRYDRVPRRELPDRVVLAAESLHQERTGND